LTVGDVCGKFEGVLVGRRKVLGWFGKKAETREDLNSFKEEMIHQFHLFSVGLVDQIKQVAEGVANVNEKLDRFREEIKNQVEERFGILSQGIAGVSKKLAETREKLSGEIEEVRCG